MAARTHSPLAGIAPFLLVACLFNLPAQARYSGGSGTADDPYQIATAADLILLGDSPDDGTKHFVLTADIDLDPNLPGRKVFDKAVIGPDTNPATGLFDGRGFSGVFDGNDHTISHLTIKGKEYIGLFGWLGGPKAQIRNLRLVDIDITNAGDLTGGLAARNSGAVVIHCYASGGVEGQGAVGGLIGANQWGNVSACHSSGIINGKGTGTGGLVGRDVGGYIADSFSDAMVTGQNDVGGLIGTCKYETVGEWVLEYRGNVVRCHSTGTVTGAGTAVGGLIGGLWGDVAQCYSTGSAWGHGNCVGGLVGENRGDRSKVGQCYSTGAVHGDEGHVGGLVGWNNAGRVVLSYSSGAVSGKYNVGGLVGYNGSGSVMHSYSTGAVSATTVYVGGLIGNPGQGVATNCFWDTQTSGQAASAAGIGKTTAELQNARTYLDSGWDFVAETANGTEGIWWILEGQDYPRLAWERVIFDDFEDGKAEPLWMAYEPEPEQVRLKEANSRLEVEAFAQDQSVDAIYAGNGWRLDASKAFALRVDFHFGRQGTGNGRVTLGVIPSLDPAGTWWAEFEAAYFDVGPIYLYEVRDGAWVEEQVIDRTSDSGTLYMSYNPDADELYFSYTGYGKPNAWKTVPGLLKGRWAGGPVYVILSGGSAGMALTSGDAWLDNFTVSTGVILR